MPAKTKTVLLMRHAKSSWNYRGLKDFERPLNSRGKKDAPKMGRYLNELQLIPDQIFSSPAARAKATTLKVAGELSIPEKTITWNENLYFKDTEFYINTIRNAENSSDIVMTVGHNPMTEDAVRLLSNHSSNKPIKTATVACFEFEIDSWKDLKFSAGALKWIVGPKDLE